MIKMMKWAIFSILLLAIAGLAFIYSVPGYSLLLVRSQSMEPAVRMGDVIVTGPINGPISGTLELGRIVTYRHGRDTITHRVLSIDGTKLTMKGDALEDPDPWTVSLSNVKGIYLFKIPKIGFALNFVRTKTGWFLAIIIPSLVLVGWLCRDILKEAFSDVERASDKKTKDTSFRMAKRCGVKNNDYLRIAKRYRIRIV